MHDASAELSDDENPTIPVRRALLLGAPAPDLSGVSYDLELMQEALSLHEFEIEMVAKTTRELVDGALLELIRKSEEDDVVIIYYSGHGARIEGPERPRIGELSYYRFLVMSDFAESTEERFRGFTSTELSIRLHQLTEKTKNVTVIMDCCFAGRIFRAADEDDEETIEWQTNPNYMPTRFHEPKGRWRRGALRFYEELQERESHALGQRHAEANPHAVQLLAASAGGVAYELEVKRKDDEPQRAGVMTWVLYRQLMAVDAARTTWQDLGRLMRRTPVRRGPNQRISIEGPFRRFMFSLEEREELGALDAEVVDGDLRLAGGWLAGLRVGDEYEFVRRTDQTVIGRGYVRTVDSSFAVADSTIQVDELTQVSSARPLRYASPRGCVELIGFAGDALDFERRLVTARIEASNLCCAWLRSDGQPHHPVAASLTLEDGKLQLGAGELRLDLARSFDPDQGPIQARHLADHLGDGCRRLTRAAMFQRLSNDRCATLVDAWTMSWRRVENGELVGEALPPKGTVLQDGERLAMEFTAGQRLSVSVFAVRADGNIELLSRAQGGGVDVEPGEAYVLGRRSFGPIRGVALQRPASSIVAEHETVMATLLIIVSDRRVDLRSWEQHGVRRYVPFDPLAPESTKRSLARPSRPAGARFRIETVEVALAPAKSRSYS